MLLEERLPLPMLPEERLPPNEREGVALLPLLPEGRLMLPDGRSLMPRLTLPDGRSTLPEDRLMLPEERLLPKRPLPF